MKYERAKDTLDHFQGFCKFQRSCKYYNKTRDNKTHRNIGYLFSIIFIGYHKRFIQKINSVFLLTLLTICAIYLKKVGYLDKTRYAGMYVVNKHFP